MARRRRRARESFGSVAPVGYGVRPHFVLGSELPIRALGGRRRKHGPPPLLADALIGPIGPPRPGWKAARHRRAAADMADDHAQRLFFMRAMPVGSAAWWWSRCGGSSSGSCSWPRCSIPSVRFPACRNRPSGWCAYGPQRSDGPPIRVDLRRRGVSPVRRR